MAQRLTVVKVGGKIVEDEERLQAFLDDFAGIAGPKVLVHGGGRSATDMAGRLGLQTTLVEGRRVTDADMLRVVTMVYGGLVNKHVVAALQQRKVNALGLTGADMDIIRAQRRPVTGGVDYGYVGDVTRVDAQALEALIGHDCVPVVAPLTHDGRGQLLNTNADTMAAEVAKALAGAYDVALVYCFEKPGVLADASDEQSVLAHLDHATFQSLKEKGTIQGGMIPKLQNAFDALSSGVGKVIVTSADHLLSGRGTVITR